MTDRVVWGVRVDRPEVDFVAEDVVAIGWDETGDLSGYPDDREPFRQVIAETRPDAKAATRASWAGNIYRFRHELRAGHLVVYPNRWEKTISIGRAVGPYFFADVPNYRHRHEIEWLVTGLDRVPTFSQGALYEIGSALTIFRVRKHAHEFLAQIGEQPVAPPSEGEASDSEGTDEPDATRIEDATRDFILDTFATNLKGHGFAEFFAELLRASGYRMIRLSPPGKDYGIDILASRDPLGLESAQLKVQCKSGTGKSGAPDVSGLLGRLSSGEMAMFVSLGGFSNDALELDRSKPELRLIGPQELVELVLERYPTLPPATRSHLPLKSVWVRDSDL